MSKNNKGYEIHSNLVDLITYIVYYDIIYDRVLKIFTYEVF